MNTVCLIVVLISFLGCILTVHKMRPTAALVCVCVSVTLIYCPKTAEPIEMAFGCWLMWAQRTMY